MIRRNFLKALLGSVLAAPLIGIAKAAGYAYPRRGEPYSGPISIDDLAFDTNATSIETAFVGHRCRVPLNLMKEYLAQTSFGPLPAHHQ